MCGSGGKGLLSSLGLLQHLLKQTLCAPGPKDPTEMETEQSFSVSCADTGQQWTAAEAGALGAPTNLLSLRIYSPSQALAIREP